MQYFKDPKFIIRWFKLKGSCHLQTVFLLRYFGVEINVISYFRSQLYLRENSPLIATTQIQKGHSMSNKQVWLTQYPQIGWLLGQVEHCMCVLSLPSCLGQFRMVLEICPVEFSLFGVSWHWPAPSDALSNMCNYLHWIPVGMKIGKSIVFEVENQKMKVKTLKKLRFQVKYGHIRGKNNKKCLNWSMVIKLLLKKFKCNFDKTLQ